MKTIAVTVLLLLAGAASCAQEPAAQQNAFARFFVETGHHMKAVVTDLRHDHEWQALVFISTAALAADMTTTCRGFSHGLLESNPLYNDTHNCAKVVIGQSAMHFGLLTLNHVMTAWLVDVCRADLDGPHRDWSMRYSNGDPTTCKHVMWGIQAPQIGINAMSAYGNECLLNGGCHYSIPVQKKKMDLLHLH